MKKIITIDGPAGSGKSTTAREIARRLQWQFLDTGAMYRTVGLAMIRAGVDPSDEDAVCAELPAHDFDLSQDDPPSPLLDGKDVSGAIRDVRASSAASKVAVHPCVRDRLVNAQRGIGERRPCVLEGRDTGTVVFPDAGLKIFLDAPVEERARRRLVDLGDEPDVTLAEMMIEVQQRDHRDRTREIGPLRQAEDAVVIDTGDLTIDGQIDAVLALARERFGDLP